MGSSLQTLSLYAVSVATLGRGLKSRAHGPRPDYQPVELFEYEACPFCRKVREELGELDLDYVCRPSAKGSNHRDRTPESATLGRLSFPYLVDPNTGVAMHESEDIIDYLRKTYGRRRDKLERALSPLATIRAGLGSVVRPTKGARVPQDAYKNRTQPAELLELYNMEGSPYCRKVREAFCELNLAYIARNALKGSPNKAKLLAKGGKRTVPYLVDPNQDIAMYESDDIVAYLYQTYGLSKATPFTP